MFLTTVRSTGISSRTYMTGRERREPCKRQREAIFSACRRHIDPQLAQLFNRLTGPPDGWASTEEEFVTFAADFLAELNVIHPFREGKWSRPA